MSVEKELWKGNEAIAEAAIRALQEDGHDFVYVHLEGPDEMAHQGLTAEKIQSIEYLDSREDIDYEAMVTILKELDFIVEGNNVYWD